MGIKEQLEEAINRIFEEEQKRRNIKSGDVTPSEAIRLDILTEGVANEIEQILAIQKIFERGQE